MEGPKKMLTVNTYQLLSVLAAVVITLFAGWSYSPALATAWAVAGAHSAQNIAWD